jgi:hypothetical protein
MSSLPEPWLRGAMPGIPAALQPAAHALVMAREDVTAAVDGISADQLWARPGGITPLGFHVAHISGSTDRLLTYARGEALNAAQKEVLGSERALLETLSAGTPQRRSLVSLSRCSFSCRPLLSRRGRLPASCATRPARCCQA